MYSDQQGSVTSSILADQLQDWVLDKGEDAILTTDGGETVTLVGLRTCNTVCSPTDTQASSPAQDSEGSSDAGVIAGALIGGLLIGVILVAVPAVIIM